MSANQKVTNHVHLLIALVASELISPTLARAALAPRVLSVTLAAIIGITIFRAVFDTTLRRRVGLIMILAMLGVDLVGVVTPEHWHTGVEVASNLATSALYGFVLWVLVNHVFSARDLRTDDIVGAFSGYILIALIWGRLYAIAYRVVPDSFSIAPGITWQLADWNTLHALFDYFSFTVISSIGYSDITTTAPSTNTLVWLEVMCGQFYLAVVVASIVGIKVSQALTSSTDGN